jgi:hypothetical protein
MDTRSRETARSIPFTTRPSGNWPRLAIVARIIEGTAAAS